MQTNGYNAKTNQIEDLVESSVIDPSIIVKNAVKVAISVAGSILTTQIVVKQNAPTN